MITAREVDLSAAAAKFAGAYVDEKFKTGSDTEKSLVLNTLAHGYYMGARHCEKFYASKWQGFLGLEKRVAPRKHDDLVKESIRASKFYLQKKGFLKLEFATQALIKATLSRGFQEGFTVREGNP